ncbi:MAG: TonB-dependent receptor [Prolixibacteraceae bacterium]|nr:TonB-dependent receptor [Prolixibacteraceae bacterium]
MTMIKTFLIFLISLLTVTHANAQSQYVLSGNISDATSGENLTGATIVVEEISNTGGITNTYGFYSITVPEGRYSIRFQFIGYKTITIPLEVNKNIILDIELERAVFELGKVEVTSERADKNISSLEMGTVRMAPGQIESIPVIFGERDVMKTIQLTPGVKAAGEGNSGFHVRGGGIDQNLILIDEAPVYSASHLLGFFSVFNSDAIKNASLLKGAVPAEYGGRASSVMDIQMKEGNLKKLGIAGNIGLISSNITVEGPIQKDKSSFMISGRRTYADLFLNFSKDDDVRNSNLYFYDLNMKTNYKINNNNRIYLSGYVGRDDFGYKDEFGFDWGSLTGTLRWNHIFSSRLFSNSSLIMSNYSYNIDLRRNLDVDIRSQIQDINVKQDFSFYMNSQNNIRFGANVIFHIILPGKITVNEMTSYVLPEDIAKRRAVEWVAYISNNHNLSDRLKLSYGLRYSLFSNIGPGEFYEFDELGELVNTTEVDRREFYKTQGGAEPRFAINYLFNRQNSLKASYNRMYQYLHLLTNTTTTTPTDMWLPSSNNVKPQVSDQVSLGYFKNFRSNEYESAIEVYYKNLKNQIDYKNGADLIYNSTVESELVFGMGWAYGAEFMLKKKSGRVNGWISYTWSRTMRQFDEISNGNPFPARHDRTHDLSVVAMYDLSKKLKLSATWVYYTGNAVTFPSGKYEIDGKIIGYYTERNGYRMPDYHRLDAGLVWQLKKTDKIESSWYFSVYNAYARENAYFIDFREKEDAPGMAEAVQVSLFRAIPSVSYRFRF